MTTLVKIDVPACEFIFLEEQGPSSRHGNIWLRKGHRITLLPGGTLSLVPGEWNADKASDDASEDVVGYENN